MLNKKQKIISKTLDSLTVFFLMVRAGRPNATDEATQVAEERARMVEVGPHLMLVSILVAN